MSMTSLSQRLEAARGQPNRAPRAEPELSLEGEIPPDKIKVLARLHGVLISVPPGRSPKVEGTPYTEAGVEKLVEALRGREGSVAAGHMLRFMEAAPGEEAVAGISVTKLRLFAEKERSLRGGLL